MVYDFSVFFEDELVADVKMDTDKNKSSIKRYVMGPKQPFMCDRQDIPYIYDFLLSRCYENGRADLQEILAAHGLTDNDPYAWNRITHGANYSDFWWIRFSSEKFTWKDVKIR